MMCLVLDDMVMKRAKLNRIGRNTRMITKSVLWGSLGVLIVNGTVGIDLIGKMLIIGASSKGTKWIIKKGKNIIRKGIYESK